MVNLVKVQETVRSQIADIFGSVVSQLQPGAQLGLCGHQRSCFQSPIGSVASEAQSVIDDTKEGVKALLQTPDCATQQKLDKLNEKRAKDGKPPLDYATVTQQMTNILDDKSLSGKQKQDKLNDLRKELGLSKGEMRDIFSNRVNKIYNAAADRLNNYQKAKMEGLKQDLKSVEQIYGKNSPQAQEIKNKMEVLKQTIEPEKKDLKSKANTVHQAFKKRGWFSSLLGGIGKAFGGIGKAIGSVAKGVGSVLGKVGSVFGRIPLVGGLLRKPFDFASGAVNSVSNLATGKIKEFAQGLGQTIGRGIDLASNAIQFIPGVGTVAGTIGRFAGPLLGKLFSRFGG